MVGTGQHLDLDQFSELLQKASGAVGGIGWLLVLVLVVIAIIIVIAVRTGTIERRHRGSSGVVFGEQVMSAAEHRSQAELAAQEARWSVAVMEAFRALVRQLGALHPRSPTGAHRRRSRSRGRRVLPQPCAGAGRRARTFDIVAYSDREGSPEGYWQVREVDEALRSARPAVVA